ncbi:hypothetical protein ACLVWU_10535 [Bdellovibrio sp. HCB290]|uniref:hypothetical protein n=1 Tax=Bdellovibrio sp. HCB290 TaxID=3394356 RepID=UPI0039B52AF2
MTNKYDQSLSKIMVADASESLEHIRDLRDQEGLSDQQLLEQRLLSFRLAIKNGRGNELDPEDLVFTSINDSFILGEAHFVRGVVYAHSHSYGKAALEMSQAALFYDKAKASEKFCLSLFNEFIFKSNDNQINGNELLSQLALIISKSEALAAYKVIGLCLRQRSYIFQSTERFQAALDEIQKAMNFIEAHCPSSDYHLALIHAADCALDLKNPEQAQSFLGYLPPELDSRVAFPLAYIKSRLNNDLLVEAQFADISEHWKSRYAKYVSEKLIPAVSDLPTWSWNLATHALVDQKKRIIGKVKFKSLEGQLLQTLILKSASKELLCEILWPEYAENHILDDRFFRLKARITQKLGEIIHFDGSNYSLSCKIEFSRK